MKGIVMTKRLKNSTLIQIVHPICCGLDVHKDKISACLITVDDNGKEQHEIREFSSFTQDLQKMKTWLIENSCPVVAMESTGVYWHPVYNTIEDTMEVVLVNARHIKNVPGRKTDICDSKWLAGLIRHGLVKGSFIPPEHVREWRELSRLRKVYTESLADYKRRVHKLFISANIKIDSIVSDLFGLTGLNLIDLLCKNDEVTLEKVQECAKGGLKKKVPELYLSLHGYFKAHHRFQLIGMMEAIEMFQKQIEQINVRLEMLTRDHENLLERLDEVPGIDKQSAQSILGEVGVTLDEFESMVAFVAWAGLCPGNNESAGKRKNGRNAVRNHPFKTILVQIAWAAIKKKGSYYKAKYYKLKSRRGARKAIVAIAHRIAKAIYSIIKNGDRYKDLGEEYLSKPNKQRVLKNLTKQAEELGMKLVPCEI
jgi:transposase